MGPQARLLPGGQRLHLQHGPSDLIVMAEGAHDRAFRAAARRFETILAELATELSALRQPLSPQSPSPVGAVAKRMFRAARPFAGEYITAMAGVAGAIADEVLEAMRAEADLTRAYVNNGGDIALYLAPGAVFRSAIKGHDGADLGRIEIAEADGIGGLATSGRHGRSLSRGIADSVTVLAKSAAQADVAATMVANAVDLPGHPAITRRPACAVIDDSDLGSLPVVTGCGALERSACRAALERGRARAESYAARGLIAGAALVLQAEASVTGGLTRVEMMTRA